MFNRLPLFIDNNSSNNNSNNNQIISQQQHQQQSSNQQLPFPFLFRFPSPFNLNPTIISNLSNIFDNKNKQINNQQQIKSMIINGNEKKKNFQKSAKQIQVQIINGNQDTSNINVILRHTEDHEALEKASTEKCESLTIISVTAGDSTSSNVVYTGEYQLKIGDMINIPTSWLSICYITDQEYDANLTDNGEILKDLNYGDEIILYKKDDINSTSSTTIESETSYKNDELFKFDLDSILSNENPSSPSTTNLSTITSTSSTTSLPTNGYQCNRCGKMFSYAYYRDKHLKYTRCVDNGDRKYPCSLCTRSFEKRDRLRIHILHVHENHRPHGCNICGKSFSQSSSLNKHLRVHSGERPYRCPFCSKSFTASSILRTHIRQHSGEKPFKCTFCGKSFASHAAHDSHVRRSHSDQNTVNLLKCQFCDKCFDNESHLLFHKQCFHNNE